MNIKQITDSIRKLAFTIAYNSHKPERGFLNHQCSYLETIGNEADDLVKVACEAVGCSIDTADKINNKQNNFSKDELDDLVAVFQILKRANDKLEVNKKGAFHE